MLTCIQRRQGSELSLLHWVERRSWLIANLLRIPVRLAQFFAGLGTGYAATYAIQPSNIAFVLGVQAIAVTTAVAWTLDWRIGAGWWATLLGVAAFGILLLPSLALPQCPSESARCVTPGTQLFTLILLGFGLVAGLRLLVRRRSARGNALPQQSPRADQ